MILTACTPSLVPAGDEQLQAYSLSTASSEAHSTAKHKSVGEKLGKIPLEVLGGGSRATSPG